MQFAAAAIEIVKAAALCKSPNALGQGPNRSIARLYLFTMRPVGLAARIHFGLLRECAPLPLFC